MENVVGARIVQAILQSQTQNGVSVNKEAMNESNREMMDAVAASMPLRAMIAFSKGAFTDEQLDEILKQVNEAQENNGNN